MCAPVCLCQYIQFRWFSCVYIVCVSDATAGDWEEFSKKKRDFLLTIPQHLNFFSSPKFEQQFFFLWAEHSFLKQRHEVGRKANGGGQTKPIFFFADNPITVRYASNGPPLPAKFFPLVCLGRFPPSLTSSLTDCPIQS